MRWCLWFVARFFKIIFLKKGGMVQGEAGESGCEVVFFRVNTTQEDRCRRRVVSGSGVKMD